jgi:transcriptional regulator of acetoin/glycerol metabolism
LTLQIIRNVLAGLTEAERARVLELLGLPAPLNTRARIMEALALANGNIGEAAVALGCSTRTLQTRLRAFGVPPAKRGPKPKLP